MKLGSLKPFATGSLGFVVTALIAVGGLSILSANYQAVETTETSPPPASNLISPKPFELSANQRAVDSTPQAERAATASSTDQSKIKSLEEELRRRDQQAQAHRELQLQQLEEQRKQAELKRQQEKETKRKAAKSKYLADLKSEEDAYAKFLSEEKYRHEQALVQAQRRSACGAVATCGDGGYASEMKKHEDNLRDAETTHKRRIEYIENQYQIALKYL